MINKNDFLNNLHGNVALWCGADADSGDLARVAETVIQKKIKLNLKKCLKLINS